MRTTVLTTKNTQMLFVLNSTHYLLLLLIDSLVEHAYVIITVSKIIHMYCIHTVYMLCCVHAINFI